MTVLADGAIAQYAVIEVRRTEGPSERLVCAYSSEESLRDLIAGPSIITCGFASREEAQANIDSPRGAARKRTQRTPARGGVEKYRPRLFSAGRALRAGFDLRHTARLIQGCLQAAVAGSILSFYSRNVFTVIRSFVGGSF